MRIQFFLFIFGLSFLYSANAQSADTVLNEKEYFINAHAMAANSFNDSLLKQYTILFPEGIYLEKALENIDVCAWQNARYKNTMESYQNYLNNFPNGKAVQLAKKNINLFEKADSEK